VKARILPLDSEEHRRARELLPWLVNGTLDALEAAEVREHVARCMVCDDDAAALEQLRDTPLDDPASEPVDRGWAAMRRRLDAPRDGRRRGAAERSWWRDGLRVAVAVEAAVIAALVLALFWDRSPAEPYRALGAVPVSEADAIAVFRADATQAEMSAALRAAQARIVGGPTVSGAYLLRLPDAEPATLDRLRAEPGVLDVQSLRAQPPR
jgi:hypothetical protein